MDHTQEGGPGEHGFNAPDAATPTSFSPTKFAPPAPSEPFSQPPEPAAQEFRAPSVYPDSVHGSNSPAPVVPVQQPAVTPGLSLSAVADDRPVPVVRVLSVRGVEYAMMTFMLWVGAAALIGIADTLISGQASFTALSFPLAALLVSLPVFAFFFLRLKRAELADPSLRLEASKRRFSQITQIVAFLICFSSIVGLVYYLIAMAGGGSSSGIGKTIGLVVVNLIVAGGILAYYWADEHRLVRR